MQLNAADKPVPREISALLSDERLILRETQRAVTHSARSRFSFRFWAKIGFVDVVRKHMPIRWKSGESHRAEFHFHSVPDSGSGGSQPLRSCQSAARGSRATGLLGMDRFPTDDMMRNLCSAFAMGEVQRLYEPIGLRESKRFP